MQNYSDNQVNLRGGQMQPPPVDPDAIVVSHSRLKFFMYTMLVIALAGIALAGVSWYLFHNKVVTPVQQPGATEEEKNSLVAEVSKLIALPDSRPTIATVLDPELLRSQPFFKNAKKGDKVLIYAKEGKTILYDPTEKKIVEVGVMDTATVGGVSGVK